MENYQYDSCNRLTARDITDPTGTKHHEYTYDRQGNMLSDGDNTYKYDSANRVSEVITKTGSIQKNRYDAEGLRAELEENGRLVSSDSEAAIAKSCVYGFCNLRIITMHLMKWVVN